MSRTGDILAMASAPAFDPNEFVSGISPPRWEQLNDPKLQPQFNRATYDAYPPGSTFKIITTIACLESGVMDPEAITTVPQPVEPTRGFSRNRVIALRTPPRPATIILSRRFIIPATAISATTA